MFLILPERLSPGWTQWFTVAVMGLISLMLTMPLLFTFAHNERASGRLADTDSKVYPSHPTPESIPEDQTERPGKSQVKNNGGHLLKGVLFWTVGLGIAWGTESEGWGLAERCV